MVECQRRGDIVAVLPRLELAAVDVVVAHASAKSYAECAQGGGEVREPPWDIAAESGLIPESAFVRWALQLLSVTVQRGNAEMYRRRGLVISRQQGLRYDAGFAVPVLMS